MSLLRGAACETPFLPSSLSYGPWLEQSIKDLTLQYFTIFHISSHSHSVSFPYSGLTGWPLCLASLMEHMVRGETHRKLWASFDPANTITLDTFATGKYL